MSQRVAGCCCGKCVNAALGVCCIKPTTNTANCLGDCEGFDPQTGTSLGIIANLTTAQCTQTGIDYGANVVFTVYPNCPATENCACIESVTECACANQNGIWNGSNSCATGCLGSCCILDLNGLPISCHNLMTECDCQKQKTSLNNVFWTLGKDCQTTACKQSPPNRIGCTLWSYESIETDSSVSSGQCNCEEATKEGIIVATEYSYYSSRHLFTSNSGGIDSNSRDWTIYNKDEKYDIYPTATCSNERHHTLYIKYTKIRDIIDQPQNSCNIDRCAYYTKIHDFIPYYPDCSFERNEIHTNESGVDSGLCTRFTECCGAFGTYPPA